MGVHRVNFNKGVQAREPEPASEPRAPEQGTEQGSTQTSYMPFTELTTCIGLRVPPHLRERPDLAQLRQQAEQNSTLDLSSFPLDIQECIETMVDYAKSAEYQRQIEILESPEFKRKMQAMLDIKVPKDDSSS